MLEIMRENASGWIVKILFGIIIVVFVFAFGMSGFDTGQDPVLATVNDQSITRAEFEDAFQRAAEGLRSTNPEVTTAQLQDPQFKQMVLGELINNRLLLDEADRLGITASDDEVFAAITRQSYFWNQAGAFDREIYMAALRSIRMTPAQFEANFKREIIAGKVTDMVRRTAVATPEQARQIYDWVGEEARVEYILSVPADFLGQVSVDEAEVEDFYATNESRFMVPEQVRVRYLLFTPKDLASRQEASDDEVEAYFEANAASLRQEEAVKASHILIQSSDADPEEKQADARKRIEAVYARAKAGGDFAALARQYSEGPSAPGGGDLGWFGRGDMVPEFEAAAFATAKGQVSEPVRSQFGWHVIFVEDRKEPGEPTLDEVRQDIVRAIAEEKAADKVTDLLDEAMDLMLSGMTLDAVADELGMLAVTSSPVPAQGLAQGFGMTPEAAAVVMHIGPGESHKTPISIEGGYMLVEKVEDIPAAPLPLGEVHESIVASLSQRKAFEMAMADAQATLERLTGPDAAKAATGLARRLKTSEPFDRQGFVPGLGQNRNLADAAFAAEEGAWLPEPFALEAGVIVARLKEIIPASEADWENQRDTWLEQANRNYQFEAINAYMTELRQQAEIKIARPDLLN
ncbi:peptidylprolyl isomerase [Pseudodesulfovibrio sp. F-1]|uniref:Periplasmic chaperone PpiD n=1 Tax=Pseudodesulfovibrio alkaliphilus TaxID=2661613 RepID=A0A7K1KKT4_9BACT|nr:SurA N-terminal domain-containing protein [Pseudodesulfovibrio alkaliphilus]MUM76688.1 peptidylprolyl isomerase [Pseudodesulfovibrio alkaliphilus]